MLLKVCVCVCAKGLTEGEVAIADEVPSSDGLVFIVSQVMHVDFQVPWVDLRLHKTTRYSMQASGLLEASGLQSGGLSRSTRPPLPLHTCTTVHPLAKTHAPVVSQQASKSLGPLEAGGLGSAQRLRALGCFPAMPRVCSAAFPCYCLSSIAGASVCGRQLDTGAWC